MLRLGIHDPHFYETGVLLAERPKKRFRYKAHILQLDKWSAHVRLHNDGGEIPSKSINHIAASA